MPPVVMHIRDTMIEAAAPGVTGMYRTPAAACVSGAHSIFGATAIAEFLGNGPVNTIELSLTDSVAVAANQTDLAPAILPELFNRLSRPDTDRLVVCLPESWRSAPVVPPSRIKRQLAQAFGACEPVFIGSGQAAGMSAIRQARQRGITIGSKLLVFTISDSDCELTECAVEQPGDRLRPIRTHLFPGIRDFDLAIGRVLSQRNNGNQRRSAMTFANNRMAKATALDLEWELIADLPDTEVIFSDDQSILVEDILSNAQSIWHGLSAEIERFIMTASSSVPAGSLMWASIGQLTGLPLVQRMVEDTVKATGINRIDGQWEPWQQASAILDGALDLASGGTDPRVFSNGASINVSQRVANGSIMSWSIPFDPYEVGGYLDSPLRPTPNAEPSPLQVHNGAPVSITLEQRNYGATLSVPTGDYFVGIQVDLEHRATLVCTDAANPQRVYSLPVS